VKYPKYAAYIHDKLTNYELVEEKDEAQKKELSVSEKSSMVTLSQA
jgi:hypothetical protein